MGLHYLQGPSATSSKGLQLRFQQQGEEQQTSSSIRAFSAKQQQQPRAHARLYIHIYMLRYKLIYSIYLHILACTAAQASTLLPCLQQVQSCSCSRFRFKVVLQSLDPLA